MKKNEILRLSIDEQGNYSIHMHKAIPISEIPLIYIFLLGYLDKMKDSFLSHTGESQGGIIKKDDKYKVENYGG